MKLVVDLDATLCDISHRMKYYGVDWDVYNSLIPGDKLNKRVYNLVRAMESDGYEIVILTGRYEKYRKLTEKWLKDNTSINYTMVMKKDGTTRTSVYYKDLWIKKNCTPDDYVIDDREEVANSCKKYNVGYIRPSIL